MIIRIIFICTLSLNISLGQVPKKEIKENPGEIKDIGEKIGGVETGGGDPLHNLFNHARRKLLLEVFRFVSPDDFFTEGEDIKKFLNDHLIEYYEDLKETKFDIRDSNPNKRCLETNLLPKAIIWISKEGCSLLTDLIKSDESGRPDEKAYALAVEFTQKLIAGDITHHFGKRDDFASRFGTAVMEIHKNKPEVDPRGWTLESVQKYFNENKKRRPTREEILGVHVGRCYHTKQKNKREAFGDYGAYIVVRPGNEGLIATGHYSESQSSDFYDFMRTSSFLNKKLRYGHYQAYDEYYAFQYIVPKQFVTKSGGSVLRGDWVPLTYTYYHYKIGRFIYEIASRNGNPKGAFLYCMYWIHKSLP